MRAVLRLGIHLRVPVGIEDDHRVRRLQVETHAARPGGEHEEEVRGVRGVELIEEISPRVSACGAIQTQVGVLTPVEVVADDVEALDHLAEEQDAVPRSLQLWQNPVQDLKLAGRPQDLLGARRLIKQVIGQEKIRVVANFA